VRLAEFGWFHPSDREDLVDDAELLILSSRAHEIYSEARSLLASDTSASLGQGTPAGMKFEARDFPHLLDLLHDALRRFVGDVAHPELSTAQQAEVHRRLAAISDTALLTFNNLRRIRVFPGLRRFVMLEGFVPSRLVATFQEQLRRYVIAVEPLEQRGAREPYIPSLVVNPRLIALFERVTLAHGAPRYHEIDPTPIIAFVFPLFFGIMFADLGHGLLLLAFGLALALRAQTRYHYWGQVLAIFGSASSLFGALFGRIFTLEFPALLPAALPFSRILTGGLTLDSAILFLELAAVIGTLHLASAYAIAVTNEIRSGNWMEAFLSHLPTLLLYATTIPAGLALLGVGFRWQELFVSATATPVFRQLLGMDIAVSFVAFIAFPILIASFVTLIFGRPLVFLSRRASPRKIGEALATGLLEAFLRPLEFLANTVSYVRLGVLLLLHAVTGSVIGGLLALGALGVPIFLVVNLALMAIEGFIVYIQDLRLHLYEWFSKFYLGFGTPFVPFLSSGPTANVSWRS
jgi:V/A-type H+-transporting ATPase subunit I